LIFANQSRKFSDPRLLGEVKFQTPTTCEIFLVLKILTCYFLVPRLSLLAHYRDSFGRLIRDITGLPSSVCVVGCAFTMAALVYQISKTKAGIKEF